MKICNRFTILYSKGVTQRDTDAYWMESGVLGKVLTYQRFTSQTKVNLFGVSW
jgi:hypothetical protein